MGLKINFRGVEISVAKGDIAEREVDAIVNPSNISLVLGGGVAGAIRRKAGPSVQSECDRLAPIKRGAAAVTAAGRLKSKNIIHAAGPKGTDADRSEVMHTVIGNIISAAEEIRAESLAIPAVSTGIFGYEAEKAVPVMIEALIGRLNKGILYLKKIEMVAFDKKTGVLFERSLERYEALQAKNDKHTRPEDRK